MPPVHCNARCVSMANLDAVRNPSSHTFSDMLTEDILLYHPTIDLSRVALNGHVIAVLVCGRQIRLALVSKLRHVVESAMTKEFQVSVYLETGGENGAYLRRPSHLDRNTFAEEENLEDVLVRKISDAGGCLEFLKLKDNVDAVFNGDDYSDDWLAETAKTRLSVSILPQLVLLRHVREVENLTSDFVGTMGAYRALYILNWVYQYFTENYVNWAVWIGRLVQTGLYCGNAGMSGKISLSLMHGIVCDFVVR